MLQDHPDLEELISFLHGRLRSGSRSRNAGVVRHLLGGCPVCRQRLEDAGWHPERRQRLLDSPPLSDLIEPPSSSPAAKSEYDAAFAKAERTLAAFFEQGKPVDEPPPALLAELFPFSSESRNDPAAKERCEAIPQLVKWLIQRSQSVRYEDPERMLHCSHMARLAVDTCPSEIAGGEQKLADLKGQTWRQFGNSLRVAGRLDEAEEAMATARTHLQAGTGDPMLWALFLNQLASLRIFERNFGSALELLAEAKEIYKDVEETHELAGTLVQKGIAVLYSGKPRSGRQDHRAIPPLINVEDGKTRSTSSCQRRFRSSVPCGSHRRMLATLIQLRQTARQEHHALTRS